MSKPSLKIKTNSNFSDSIVEWYKIYGRHDLPWRNSVTPYKVWISEIMLQQTTVATVIPFYKRFLKKWPSLKLFMNATLEEILYEWQGLGYYQRAKNLFKAKEFLKTNKLIVNSKNLLNIPGIGEYTSSSISAILKDESCAVIDGNIEFFSDYIGPFAYEKLANVQSNSVKGGMESATTPAPACTSTVKSFLFFLRTTIVLIVIAVFNAPFKSIDP